MKNITLLSISMFLCSALGNAQVMIKDIIPGGVGSYPTAISNCNGTLLFTALDANLVFGENELWKTDGTSEGTVIVKDINPNGGSIASNFSNLIVIGNYAYFKADDGVHGQELWKTDGTPEGTVMVKDIHPTVGGRPTHMLKVGNTLYFSADDGIHGRELWKSDGTEAGTVMVKDARPGEYGSINSNSFTSTLTELNGVIFYSAQDGTNGEELWKSDGTEAGTVMVKNVNMNNNSGIYPETLIAYKDKIYFSANDQVTGHELYVSDGTEEGTMLFKDINSSSSFPVPNLLTISNDYLFFNAGDGVHGSELWRTDGTVGGTIMLKDINEGTGGAFLGENKIIDFKGQLYFTAYDGETYALWKSDGTPEGTVIAVNTDSAIGLGADMFYVTGDLLLFSSEAATLTGMELWKTDGTQGGTQLVMDINSGNHASSPGGYYNHNGMIYFSAETDAAGRELWKYDISATGGVDEVNLKGVNVYPNPFEDVIHISNNNDTDNTYAIFDVLGKQLMSGTLTEQESKINAVNLASGMYFLKIGNGQSNAIRIVKK